MTSPSPTAPAASRNWINAGTRAAALEGLEQTATQPLDVLVVGGGITGVGVALDAAARGLRVALVERRDLGSGTSGYSSKLAHGGLRYLAKGDVALARESATERHHLLTTIAPHLVRPSQTVIPLGDYLGRAEGLKMYAGLRLADLLRVSSRTPAALLPSPSRISAQELLLLAPALDRAGLRGGLTYWDGQIEDDVRLVVAVARTAAAHGAQIVTRCAATDVNARSATLTDTLTGDVRVVHADVVVNATGVWADRIAGGLQLTPSRGTHLVVRSSSLGDPRAILTVPVPGTVGRYVFAIPQPDGLTYVGLTDEPAPGEDPYAPQIPEADERFLLSTLGTALRTPLTADDVVGRFAGLRPLVSDGTGGASADLSRRHLLLDRPGQPITITGGKLTTYRKMAEDTVDAVLRRLGRQADCVTAELPLVGAADRGTLGRIAAPPRLVRRYGTEAPSVAALATDDPTLLEPVAAGSPVLGVEVVHAVLAEGALDVDDFLDRRVRAGFVPADREAIRWECTKIVERARAALRSGR
ncbi:glycerol-3-phosphate dehydrogenase/oxidase [Cumulibacter manganitolerans]|uniref:glycerol-3-phosphate dehydrogenase/oxidase n=1 Tax=Cumulibacter manganitolerans TaxID=1884992 RepID=UPI001296DD88|nr:glycerol-3-phosphate dehydrogenase/oxidase [Cumulibacter manganitolerans]